jgi:hypothetical protein
MYQQSCDSNDIARYGPPITTHHTSGEQSQSSYVSHGRRHGQATQLQTIKRSTKYKEAWSLSSANEFRRLANGIGSRINNPTNTIEFRFQHEVPTERLKDITYRQFVCTVRPEKAEPNRTRFTVGGDRINYPGAVATPTADMLVAKMLFNSVISTKLGCEFGAEFRRIPENFRFRTLF